MITGDRSITGCFMIFSGIISRLRKWTGNSLESHKASQFLTRGRSTSQSVVISVNWAIKIVNDGLAEGTYKKLTLNNKSSQHLVVDKTFLSCTIYPLIIFHVSLVGLFISSCAHVASWPLLLLPCRNNSSWLSCCTLFNDPYNVAGISLFLFCPERTQSEPHGTWQRLSGPPSYFSFACCFGCCFTYHHLRAVIWQENLIYVVAVRKRTV